MSALYTLGIENPTWRVSALRGTGALSRLSPGGMYILYRPFEHLTRTAVVTGPIPTAVPQRCSLSKWATSAYPPALATRPPTQACAKLTTSHGDIEEYNFSIVV